jgi:RNA-binding protein YlmH
MRSEWQAQKAACLKSFTDADDKILFEKEFDKFETCIQKFLPTFTDFLDPQRAEKFLFCFERYAGLERIAVTDKRLEWLLDMGGNNKGDDANMSAGVFGGFDNAERVMIGFSPEGALTAEAFPITVLQIKYNARFAQPPTHRDYLGSVLGLGLERAKIGDILLLDGFAAVYAGTDAAEFVAANLERVGRVPVTVSIYTDEMPFVPAENGTARRLTVASLRLDVIISGAFRLSRAMADKYISSEKVFVNWKLTANGAKTLAEGDIITVRGLGRIQLEAETGKTKKGRTAVSVILF